MKRQEEGNRKRVDQAGPQVPAKGFGLGAARWELTPPAWCLPSGQRLAEYMLQAGFLAPWLGQPRAKRASSRGGGRDAWSWRSETPRP